MMMMPCGAAGLLAVAVCVVPWPASWPAPSKLPLALALAYDRCTDVDRLRIYAVTLIAVTLLVFLLWDLLLSVRQVIDPFVGRGTTLAMAEKYGFSSVGVDNDRAQCEYASALTVQDVDQCLKRKTR
jgi:hypothetical protein